MVAAARRYNRGLNWLGRARRASGAPDQGTSKTMEIKTENIAALLKEQIKKFDLNLKNGSATVALVYKEGIYKLLLKALVLVYMVCYSS